jgi:uncharacterized protein DUF6353
MKYVPNAITRTVGRAVLTSKHHSPAILFGAGVVGMGATIALAIKATLQVEDVLVVHQKDMMDIHRIENGRTADQNVDYDRERQHITLRTTGRLIKLYAPTAVAGVITVTCLTASHRQLTNRNAQLTAAYVALQRFLEGYRGRVREEIGEEKERDVYYAATPVELVQDTDNGPVKYFGTKPGMRSPYACMFNDQNANFQESGTFNEHFFRIQGELLTNKLRSQGHLFLNEVYDRLGVPRTPTGQVAGWALQHPDSDDFVEIRFTPVHDYHGSYMLDFNVAGHVMNMAFGVGQEG